MKSLVVCVVVGLSVLFVGYAAAKDSRPAVAPIPAAKPNTEVEWSDTWWPATVVKTKGDKYYIHYDGWGEEWDEWVGKDRIRFNNEKVEAPQQVEVLWGEQWWSATVVKTVGKRYYIHYTGWGDEWDEWVGKDRIYFPTKKATPAAAAKPMVEVQWGGTWWPASILMTTRDQYLIHYEGWGTEWDEWVGQDRIRVPGER
jgi:hypothetical protein